jgi:hypothetical protein
VQLDSRLRPAVSKAIVERLRPALRSLGVELVPTTAPGKGTSDVLKVLQSAEAPAHPEGYTLLISGHGITLHYRQPGGLRAGVATLRQLLREFGRRLPQLAIRDYPDFQRRGVMLDISRGRVPKLETLLGLADTLADFKINELQLYTEHTFAYRNYRPVWEGWGPITGPEILRLDARCRELGIDLVPNQNSFGHLRYWLEYPPLKKLAETRVPYEGHDGNYIRHPATLAPNHPDTLPFLRELYDELLPHFTSRFFNVGCDETWDLGRGQSKELCAKKGYGRVYFDFLKKIHREVSRRNRRMMFWGDILLKNPDLVREVPKDAIALDWGYEPDHPFEQEAALLAKARVPFYVCPGTSSWMSLVGRHDHALPNLRRAAAAGRKFGALGYLNTDWGDGGHPQPLAVSYLPYLVGASVSWCLESFEPLLLVSVLSRDVFRDPTQHVARAALALGLAHRKLDYYAALGTPLGAVIAAPVPSTYELTCRQGLKYYARIPEKNIRAALAELEGQRRVLADGKPATREGAVLARELDLAARMAEASCHIMLWQQALAAGKAATAKRLATAGIRELRQLDNDYRRYWPLRNKGTPEKSAPFLRWRMEDYRRGVLHFPPEVAREVPRKRVADE